MENSKKKVVIIVACIILLFLIILFCNILKEEKPKETSNNGQENSTTNVDNNNDKLSTRLLGLQIKNAKQIEISLLNSNAVLTEEDFTIMVNGNTVKFKIAKLENGNYEITLDDELKENDKLQIMAKGNCEGTLEKIYELTEEKKTEVEPTAKPSTKPITKPTTKPTTKPIVKPSTKPTSATVEVDEKPKETSIPQNTTETTKKYTITFNSNGGTTVPSQTVENGKKAIKPSNPTKSGYTFEGWTLNGIIYDFNSTVSGNITLVASWKQNEDVYTYSVNTINGDTLTVSRVVYIYKNGVKINNVSAVLNSNSQTLGKYKSELNGCAIDVSDQDLIKKVKLSDGTIKNLR